MPYKFLDKKTFLVQVQRAGIRKTKRGTGSEADAKRAEALLIAEIDGKLELERAARLLGVETTGTTATARVLVPTLREFIETRWVEHARVVQNEGTQRTSQTPLRYLVYYLGDKRLDELVQPSVINAFVEAMKEKGPISFTLRRDGQPRRRKCEALTNATINKALQCLQALLNLAHAEDVIDKAARIDMLPTDDSTPVIPPTEEQFQQLLGACGKFCEVAPLLADVVAFTAETGLRRAEIFHLTWASVDLARAALRVEMQQKGRMVNGRPWRPKHNKWREVPLSTKAKAILEQRRADGPSGADDLVFPNQGGAPYDRMDRAPAAAGKGYFFDAVEVAGLKGKVTFHGLRHLFAVRLLTRGVPITVVSEILGHSDVNLTVKRYGRFASDAKVKWEAIKALDVGRTDFEA